MLAEKLEWQAVGYSSGTQPQPLLLQRLKLTPREDPLDEEEISRRATLMLQEITKGKNR